MGCNNRFSETARRSNVVIGIRGLNKVEQKVHCSSLNTTIMPYRSRVDLHRLVSSQTTFIRLKKFKAILAVAVPSLARITRLRGWHGRTSPCVNATSFHHLICPTRLVSRESDRSVSYPIEMRSMAVLQRLYYVKSRPSFRKPPKPSGLTHRTTPKP